MVCVGIISVHFGKNYKCMNKVNKEVTKFAAHTERKEKDFHCILLNNMGIEGRRRYQGKRIIYSSESSQETETTVVNLNRGDIKNF